MSGMSKKETARLLDHIEPQGVKITRVSKGFLLRLPDGGTTTVHLTNSDHRADDNLRARLKRAGISWPTDGHAVKSKPTKATLEKGRIVLEKMGFPNTIRVHDFITAASLIDWNVAANTVVAFLQTEGYMGIGSTVSRRYRKYTDTDIEPEPTVIVPITDEVELQAKLPAHVVEHREFLDTHDSWTMDTTVLPESLTLKDMQLMFAALGINFEIRVWK